MQSWDVYDTLIARRCVTNRGVFEIMAERIGDPDFPKQRQQADLGGDIVSIYLNLAKSSGRSKEQVVDLMRLELQTEVAQAFLIPEIYDQVKDGDLLLSDMYLGEAGVRAVLSAVGFAKKVQLIVTPMGKRSGAIWTTLKQQGMQISRHTGNDVATDVVSPTRNHIQGRYFRRALPYPLEKSVAEAGFVRLARVMRAVRLQNPHLRGTLDHVMWEEQAQINGPLLYFASLHLEHYHRLRHPYDKILFPSRDACHWVRLHQVMFPAQPSMYFETSRKLMQNPNEAFINYVRSFGDLSQVVIADCHGTGRSIYSFFPKYFDVLPFCYTITSFSGIAPMVEKNRIFAIAQMKDGLNHHRWIEELNADMVGTLEDFTPTGPVRPAPLYDTRHLRAYHAAIGRFIEEVARAGVDKPPAEPVLRRWVENRLHAVEKGLAINSLMEEDHGYGGGAVFDLKPVP